MYIHSFVLSWMVPQCLWVHVHNASHQALDNTELTVNSDYNQHEEEDNSPNTTTCHLKNNLWICDEDKPRTTVDNIRHINSLVMSHVTKYTEGYDSSQETCSSVDKTGDNGVLDAVVVELVVGSKGRQSSSSNRVCKEDLSSWINPTFRSFQFWPVRGDVEKETLTSAL